MGFLTALSLIYTTACLAQYKPAEGSRLNYRLIYFSFPEQGSSTNTIEIAHGNVTNEADFARNIVRTYPVTGTSIIGEVPLFGNNYTWRVVSGSKAGRLNHFSVLKDKYTDESTYRFRVQKESARYKDGYILCDGTRAIYDINGHPVWYLPAIPGEIDSNSVIRDMKITATGTITFLSTNSAYEVNYDGKLVWKAPRHPLPNGDSIERYHHDMTKLSNGHYMVMGTDSRAYVWRHTSPSDSILIIQPAGYENPQPVMNRPAKIQFATLLEFDEKGKLKWSWSTTSYFAKLPPNALTRQHQDTHANAFYFDESSGCIYVSIKNTSEILKIKYPEGTVLNVFDGENDVDQESSFCEQHTCKLNRDGNLYIFNNNMCRKADGPGVVVFRETANGHKLEKVWQFEFGPEQYHLRQPRTNATSGGSASELADGALFISLCVPDGNMYIVNENKDIEWQAALEKFNATEADWRTYSFYRASMTTDKKIMGRLVKGTNN
jgi:hypothetical protein